jgi:hypothetical protein
VPQPAGEVGRAGVYPAAVAPGVRARHWCVAVTPIVVDQQVHLARGHVIPVRRGALRLGADVGAAAAGAGPGPVQACGGILHKDVLARLILEEAEVGIWLGASVRQDGEVDYVGWCLVDVGRWCAESLEVAGVCGPS